MTSWRCTTPPGLVRPRTAKTATSQAASTRQGWQVTAWARRFIVTPCGLERWSPQEASLGRTEQLGGGGDALGERGLGLAAPRAGVVGGLAPQAAVDLEHAVVVGEDVVGDGAREGVLAVGVEVDLD